jgi:membrane protein involved in colicin uptake
MPLTGNKGYAKNEVTDVGKKVVDVASGATPSGAVVRGGRAAAKWALDKYRAYSKAKAKRDADEAKKKAAAEKAKNEARADELYGKGTTVKPEPKPTPTPKPEPKKTGVVASVKTTAENLRKKAEILKEVSKDN